MLSSIGITANLEKPGVAEVIGKGLDALKEAGLVWTLASEVAEPLGLPGPQAPEVEMVRQVDAVVCLGGDGTLLRVARVIGEAATPLLGINFGGLGFLAEVPEDEMAKAMGCLARGEYRLEKRKKVKVEVWRDESCVFSTTALNDAVINMGSLPRAIDLEVLVAGTRLGRYLADGLIVATPTGSTAYNLSAGGPLIDPSLDAFVLTPICPHSLGVRPMILDLRHSVEVRVSDGSRALLTADGQLSTNVGEEDRVVFGRTQEPVYFLHLPQRDFFQTIQQKLLWGGHRRRVGRRSRPRPKSGGRRAT